MNGPLPRGAVPVLTDGATSFDAPALDRAVDALAARLRAQGTRVFGTWLDNGCAWALADLAAARAGVVHVPLPLFFTAAQRTHAVGAAGIDTVLAPPAALADWPLPPGAPCAVGGSALAMVRIAGAVQPALPAGTAKITFTSGTTGLPKGVCLRQSAMEAVAQGLVRALAPLEIGRHLCALPLAVLLENIAGLLAPLCSGATCVLPPLAQVGLHGSSQFDPGRLQRAVERFQPHSMILLPQMLRGWTAWLHATGARAPASLRFVAVGGAAVGAGAIAQARALGVPAYEGYGLSEGASVQTLNLPGADCPGSAGRPLPHARLRIGAGGEVQVAGSLFAGYLGDAHAVPDWWPTGDLGRLDDQGFLHLSGRRSNVLITSFGRNVSPEWVETALAGQAAVAQAVVFGDGQPGLSAVLWPQGGAGDASLQAAVDAANAGLPDYARVRHWVRARAPFTAQTGMATANGRPLRAAVQQLHAPPGALQGA